MRHHCTHVAVPMKLSVELVHGRAHLVQADLHACVRASGENGVQEMYCVELGVEGFHVCVRVWRAYLRAYGCGGLTCVRTGGEGLHACARVGRA